ncbi:SDR family oxidoreductase [Streptomyces sp. NPDC051172]|uniref:SDR family NAD(P)-dependent oxidoreductase n=1 Tax=Streptomyces sp. NPDC051172 TaxID=3155796 RepID=UPI00342D3083
MLATTADDWDQVMAINGRGIFLTCKNAITAMHGSGVGSIVCVSSISGIAGQSGQAAYGPSKFVVSGLVKHLAVEWAARGIRINAVAPGSIRTAGLEHIGKTREGQRYIEEITRAHPIGRLGLPDEVARAIAFLASDDASFITGAILPVDGGYLAQ